MGLRRNRNYGKMAKKVLRATPTKKTVAKAVNKAKVSNLKKIVKSVIASDIETKKVYDTTIAQQYAIPGSGLDYGPITKGFISTSLIPNPAIGTSSAARIGNLIKPKRLNVRYSLYAQPSTDSVSSGGNTNPFIGLPFLVKIVIFRARFSTSDNNPLYLINDGATSGSLTDVPDSFFRPYNRDQYLIGYSKVHKMQAPRHATSVAGSFTASTQDSKTGSFVVNSVNLKMLKFLKYNDNNSAYPTNAAWYMAAAVCNVDGTVVSTIQSRVRINVESYMSYHDE